MDLLHEIFDVPSRPHAVVVVAMRGSRVLLCQGRERRRTWCLPGGKVEERDQTPTGALFREFEEECGLRPQSTLWLPAEPFLQGYTHDLKPMWCYQGKIDPSVPDAWDAPEGRCEFVELLAAPQLYRLDWLRTFCKLMQALPSLNRKTQGYLLHLVECESCRTHPARLCDVGIADYRAALGVVP